MYYPVVYVKIFLVYEETVTRCEGARQLSPGDIKVGSLKFLRLSSLHIMEHGELQ